MQLPTKPITRLGEEICANARAIDNVDTIVLLVGHTRSVGSVDVSALARRMVSSLNDCMNELMMPAPRVVESRGEHLKRTCARLLDSVRRVDSDASISSVMQWDTDDSTMVRLRSSKQGASLDVLRALRQAWPLAQVAMVENMADGVSEAQIIVPNNEEAHVRALSIAHATRPARVMARVLSAGGMILLVVFAVSITARVVATE